MYIVFLCLLCTADHHKLFFLPVLVCVCEINPILSHSQVAGQILGHLRPPLHKSPPTVCWLTLWWQFRFWLLVMLVINTSCSNISEMLFVTSKNWSLLLPVSLQCFYHLIVAISEEFPNTQPALLSLSKSLLRLWTGGKPPRCPGSTFSLQTSCRSVCRVQVSNDGSFF